MNKNILKESLDSLIGENNNNDLKFKSKHKFRKRTLRILTCIIITFTNKNI